MSNTTSICIGSVHGRRDQSDKPCYMLDLEIVAYEYKVECGGHGSVCPPPDRGSLYRGRAWEMLVTLECGHKKKIVMSEANIDATRQRINERGAER